MSIIPAAGTVRASDLLASQAKKFTMDMPSDLHYTLKQIAAAHRTTVKDLVIEALSNYTLPQYQKEVK